MTEAADTRVTHSEGGGRGREPRRLLEAGKRSKKDCPKRNTGLLTP